MADYVIIGGELYHHGVKGQRWGVRRYQNEDGTLTDAGKERYYNSDDQLKLYKQANKLRGRFDKIDDIKEAGNFLKKQNELITEQFNEYYNSYCQTLDGLKNNSKFISDVKGRLKNLKSDTIEYYEVMDTVDEIIEQYTSEKTKKILFIIRE